MGLGYIDPIDLSFDADRYAGRVDDERLLMVDVISAGGELLSKRVFEMPRAEVIRQQLAQIAGDEIAKDALRRFPLDRPNVAIERWRLGLEAVELGVDRVLESRDEPLGKKRQCLARGVV